MEVKSRPLEHRDTLTPEHDDSHSCDTGCGGYRVKMTGLWIYTGPRSCLLSSPSNHFPTIFLQGSNLVMLQFACMQS